MKELTPELQLVVLNMVAKVGIEATAAILRGMKNASTIDDAIAALDKASSQGYREAKIAPIQ